MKEPIAQPRIINSANTEWGDHPRFAGVFAGHNVHCF